MIKLNFNLRIPQIDVNKLEIDLNAAIEDEMIKGIRRFLVAAVPRVPIYTGFARSAYRNLEDIGGRVGSDRSSPSGFRIRGTLRGSSQKLILQPASRYPHYYRGVLKTTDSGRQFATPPNQIITKIQGRASVSFKFAIDIDYFDKLDREKWHSFQAGIDAFTEYMRTFKRRNPLPMSKYITRKQVT